VLGREAYVGGGIQQYRESVALWHGPDAHAEFLARSQQDAYDLARATGQDLVRPSYWRMPQKPTRRIDDRTFLYGDPDGDYIVRRFDPETELYQAVASAKPEGGALGDLPAVVERHERAAAAYVATESAFAVSLEARAAFGAERAVPVYGCSVGLPNRTTAWWEALALQPDLVARYLNAQAERSVKNAVLATGLGFRVFLGGADFAGNQGPFFSPKVFRELFVPPMQRVAAAIHQGGGFWAYASDGNLWPVAEDLFGRSGVDGFYEIDRRAGMDLGRLRQAYPDLTLLGNVSSHTLHTGTPQDVIDETRSCIEEAKRSGSILVGVSNQVVAQTPPANLFAMLETIEREQ
jgi:uroporphyrinogen decarboxylase